MESGLRALLYVSQLAEGLDARAVAQVLAVARLNNALHGETGVLVFDGEQFCQYVEGETPRIRALLRNLLADPRHENMRILADLPIGARHFQTFRMGYVTVDDVDVLHGLANAQAGEAVARFQQLVASFDVEA